MAKSKIDRRYEKMQDRQAKEMQAFDGKIRTAIKPKG